MSSSTFPTNQPLQALSDAELFAQFLAHRDEAFTALYHRYAARLLGYVHSILGEAELACDDIFQESFLRLFRERNNYAVPNPPEPIRNVGGWLFRVARNLALNHLRSCRYLADLDASFDERLLIPIEESFPTLFGEHADDAMLLEAVDAVVKTLPTGLREAFVLREVNGLSYQETARLMGCSEEAARMRLSRARSAIRRALQPLLDGVRRTGEEKKR